MAIVLVIIRVHRSSILSFRSKVVVMVVVVAAVVVMFVVPFFPLSLFRSISRLVCVLFLFFFIVRSFSRAEKNTKMVLLLL